jgi:hypothetical protein
MSRSDARHLRLLAFVLLLGVAAAYLIGGLRARPPADWFGLAGESDYGYRPDPEGVAEFLRELPEPMFRQAGADTISHAKGVDTFLYRSAYNAHQALYGRPWVVERQGIGDCVSWGWAHGVWIAQCVDWETGRLANPPPFPATEAIYGGSRVEARGRPEGGGGWSDGSYGAAAARWVKGWGIVYREQFDRFDLSAYSADRAKQWGNWGCGGQGDGGRLDAIAKRHPAAHVAMVKTFDEAAAAIEAGFPIPVCSLVGFESVRDQHAYARASGQWAHCMCFVAVRYAKNGSPDDALLCLNSWGPRWISGPKWPADMPDGAFWVRRATVDRMLGSQPDSFAVGSVQGFGWRDLSNDVLAEPPADSGPVNIPGLRYTDEGNR